MENLRIQEEIRIEDYLEEFIDFENSPFEKDNHLNEYNHFNKDEFIKKLAFDLTLKAKNSLASRLKDMKIEARNGFRYIPFSNQGKIIQERKDEIQEFLQNKDFERIDTYSLGLRVNKILMKTYIPFLNTNLSY